MLAKLLGFKAINIVFKKQYMTRYKKIKRDKRKVERYYCLRTHSQRATSSATYVILPL